MRPRSVLVKVPATVGNFAGAMNCAALTLDAMFNVKVTPMLDGHVGIRYFGENGDRVPRDRSNLVVRAMEAALHLKGLEFSGADFEIYSSVPVGVGMGSSTAAVLAGGPCGQRVGGRGGAHLERAVLCVRGVDYESLDYDKQEYNVKRLEAALKNFDSGFHVYQYLFKTNNPEIPFASYDDSRVQTGQDLRRELFRQKADRLFEIEFLDPGAEAFAFTFG